MKSYYVYILKCSDGTFYTGITSRLHERILEHQEGIYPNSYTAQRLPVELVFFTSFSCVNTAIEMEKKIKKWSKAKKEAIINDEWEKLPNLAKKKF